MILPLSFDFRCLFHTPCRLLIPCGQSHYTRSVEHKCAGVISLSVSGTEIGDFTNI